MSNEYDAYERKLIAKGRKEERERILEVMSNTFTEGWWSYFNTTYGVDDIKINEEMLGDIDRKITQMKNGIIGSATDY